MDGLFSSVLFMVFCLLWHVCFVNPSYLLELKHVPVFAEGVTCSFFGLSTPCHVASTVQWQLWMFGDSPSVLSLLLWCAVTNKDNNTLRSYGFLMSMEGKAFSFNFINIIATQSNLYSNYLPKLFCLFRKRTGLFLLQPEDPLSILLPAIIQLFLY